jgi:ABC-type sugar transport system ATPase subunit
MEEESIRLLAGEQTQTINKDVLNVPASLKAGTTFSLGIRPEHIRILTEPTPDSIQSELYVTQTLGGEALVIVRVGDHLISVRLFEDAAPELPSQVYLTFAPERLFFYDKNGELLL